jgi:MFS family permease
MFSLGAGIGAATGFFAVQLGLSLPQHFIVASVVLGIVVFLIANISWQSTKREMVQKPPLFAIPKGPLLLIGVVAFCCAIGEGGMADWSAIFLINAVDAGEARAAIGYTLFSVGMVSIRFAGGKLIDLFGQTTIVRYGALSAFIGCMAAIISVDFYVSLIGFVLMGCGYALVIPIAFSKAAEMAPNSPGVAIAGVSTFGYGGMLLGPPLIGFTAEIVSIRFAFLIFACLACLMFILAQAMEGRARIRAA